MRTLTRAGAAVGVEANYKLNEARVSEVWHPDEADESKPDARLIMLAFSALDIPDGARDLRMEVHRYARYWGGLS